MGKCLNCISKMGGGRIKLENLQKKCFDNGCCFETTDEGVMVGFKISIELLSSEREVINE